MHSPGSMPSSPSVVERRAMRRTHADSGIEELVRLLAMLVEAPSVVGAEAPFMRVLERELVRLGATVRPWQGVLEAHGDDPDGLVISVHVDRHGILCTGPGEFQYAAYVTREQGDLDGNSISEQTVAKLSDRFDGAAVEAYDPWHGGYLGQGTVTAARACERRGNMVFEVAGLGDLRPGTPIAYTRPLAVRDDRLAAQLDNVLSVALVVDMFRRGFRGTALFTAEEEAGRSWRYVLQWFRRRARESRRLLVVDTSPYPDDEAAGAQDLVLRRGDANGRFDEAFVAEIEGHCRAAGARCAFKDEQIVAANREREARGQRAGSLGRTELGRLVAATGGAITGATLQLPTTGYHTANETVTLRSLALARAATDEIIRGMDAGGG